MRPVFRTFLLVTGQAIFHILQPNSMPSGRQEIKYRRAQVNSSREIGINMTLHKVFLMLVDF